MSDRAHEQLVVGRDVPGPPRHRRPDEQARADRQPPAEPVGDVAADRAEERVDPLELAEHEAPVRLGADVGDVAPSPRTSSPPASAGRGSSAGRPARAARRPARPCAGRVERIGRVAHRSRCTPPCAETRLHTSGDRTPGRTSPLGIPRRLFQRTQRDGRRGGRAFDAPRSTSVVRSKRRMVWLNPGWRSGGVKPDLRAVVAAEDDRSPIRRSAPATARRRRTGQVGDARPAFGRVVAVRVLQVSAFDLPVLPRDQVHAARQPERPVERRRRPRASVRRRGRARPRAIRCRRRQVDPADGLRGRRRVRRLLAAATYSMSPTIAPQALAIGLGSGGERGGDDLPRLPFEAECVGV